MPKIDTNLYAKAKQQHDLRFSKKWKKVAKQVASGTVKVESMVIVQEYRELLESLKVLNKRRKYLKAQIDLMGLQSVARSDYFNKPISLYVLELEDHCWYIGMSRNVTKRVASHTKGKGAIWTKAHKPIKLHATLETGTTSDSEASLMEDQLTLEYAMNYGHDKVRGGGYCQTKPVWPRVVLEN